jgi:hypothetical protein
MSEKVTLDFIHLDPATRVGNHRYAPAERFKLEIIVGDEIFHVEVGPIMQGDGTERIGIHIIYPSHLFEIVKRVSTVSILKKPRPPGK